MLPPNARIYGYIFVVKNCGKFNFKQFHAYRVNINCPAEQLLSSYDTAMILVNDLYFQVKITEINCEYKIALKGFISDN